MLDALAAEFMKFRGHKATWFLVWIYPIALIVIFVVAITVGMARHTLPPFPDTTLIWGMPKRADGRYLIAAFVAVVFAGEYGWNTWKLIVPHRSRTTLLASKYVVTITLLLLAYVLAAGITIIGFWAAHELIGGKFVPLTANALLHAHAQAALAALPPMLVTIAYTSLAAVLSRSTIAALVIGIAATSVEQLLYSLGPMLSMLFETVTRVLYQALPGYHLANLASWIGKDVALRVRFPVGEIVALHWTTSLAVISAWIVVLVAAALAIFRRQDIN
jgi:ABC-type transport system involved in multi-copper enzyme maturation permease subunit